MRAHFGGYFFGQVLTFIYLLQSMSQSVPLDAASWPQFSVYNLVVANFWPFYWVIYFVDSEKLDDTYWQVYDVAQVRVAEALNIIQIFFA
jgi:hypothetical protein